MTLPERLAVESLLSDISDINKNLNRLDFQYQGPSWKRPNTKAHEFNPNLSSFQFSSDSEQNLKTQLGLLEILVDRIHFLLLSATESKSDGFISIGKASKILMTKLLVLHQAKADNNSTLEDVQAHINQTIASRGSEIFYSPNYEEDLRREMFPIVSNLISTVTSICDQNGIPSASCQLWESEKARVDKRIFVKVTTAIRKDMERISRLFQKLEKTKIQLKKDIESKNEKIRMEIASNEGLRATMKRKETEAERRLNDLKDQLELRISVSETEKKDLFNDRNRLKSELTRKNDDIQKANIDRENLNRKILEIEADMADGNHKNLILQENIEKKINEIEGLKKQITNLNGKFENEKKTKERLKSKLIELSENETKFNNQILKLQDELERTKIEKKNAEGNIINLTRQNQNELLSVKSEFTKYKTKCESHVCPGCLSLTASHRASQSSITAAGDARAADLESHLYRTQDRMEEMEKDLKLLAAYPDLNVNIRTKYYSDNIGPPGNGSIQNEMENQIKANQKRIQLIQSENQKLISALGRLHNPNYESETSSLQERHRDNLDLHEPEDIEVLDLEEDQFSIPSTLTATARAPSRINSGKFQGQVYNRSSRRVASPMYLSTSHRVSSVNSACVQWNSGRR